MKPGPRDVVRNETIRISVRQLSSGRYHATVGRRGTGALFTLEELVQPVLDLIPSHKPRREFVNDLAKELQAIIEAND